MSSQRRNRRAGVEDLWHRADGTPTARHGAAPCPPRGSCKVQGRGKRWRARWVDDQGQERTASYERKIDAQSKIDGVSADLHRGEYVDPRSGTQSFGALSERFTSGRTVKQKTASGEKSLLDSRILPRWQNVQIAHIVESDIRTWLADMQKEVSSSRARQAFILYRQILDLAVADKALVRNPAAGVKAPRAKTSRDAVFLTVDQVHEIADAMPRPADAALVRFLAFTGLRWGEAVAVTVDGIDFDRHIIHVRRTYSEDGGRVITGTPKDHAARWVPFPAGMDSDLRALANGRLRGSDVFQTPAGGVLRSGNWTARVLRPAVEDVNAPKDGEGEREDVIPPGLRIHDLRHTAASVAIRAGVNVKALQRMLGHESATMTLDVYAGLWDDDLRDLGSSVNSVAYPLRTSGDR